MSDDPASIDGIFCAAIEIASPQEREQFIQRRCQHDPALRARLDKLLDAHTRAGEFLETAAPRVAQLSRIASEVAVGSQIGRYRIIKQLGEGGIGTVFLAEQTSPLRRSVALKFIKLGMDTRQVIARFEQERQALAMMDHPHIARVIDASATDSGRPFFVMELVEGVPITNYCDHNNLDIPQRLELFMQVCQAVQHAHQKGLIHRDIKPSNVLVGNVDGAAVAKVIDFGIAKAIGPSLAEQTLMTESRQLIGTLEYMSPEQAEGSLDIDTRTDVYSLGVLLYELLTHTTPFEGHNLRSSAFHEIQRIIRDSDPPKPSTRLAKLSATHAGGPRGTVVRGELDWIVMKCIEKDRARRYESASALAADIAHHLADEPISAAAPSRAYRTRKFVRRHRVGVIASSAVVLALIAGTIGTTIGLIGQARQRAFAEAKEKDAVHLEAIALAVSRFQGDMFRAISPWQSGESVTALQVLESAVKDLDAGGLKDQPLAEANVRLMIGQTLHTLGRYSEAETNFRKALALRREVHPEPSASMADLLNGLATTVDAEGKLDEAERLSREALQMRQQLFPADSPQIASSYQTLGTSVLHAGKFAEAEKLCRAAVAIRRAQQPPDLIELARSLATLGWTLQLEGKFTEAESVCREALDLDRRDLPAAHPDIAEDANVLAVILARSGRAADAEPLFRESLETDRKVFPATHPRIGEAMNNLAAVLQEQGKLAEAEPLQREGLALRQKVLPAGSMEIAQSMKNLAMLLEREGKYAEAEQLARQALEIRRKGLPAGHPEIAGALRCLGKVLCGEKRFAESEAKLLEAWQLVSRPNIPEGLRLGCSVDLGQLYKAWDADQPGNGYAEKAAQWQKRATPATTAASAPTSR